MDQADGTVSEPDLTRQKTNGIPPPGILIAIQYVFALLPITWIVLFYTLAYHISTVLDRWPRLFVDGPQFTIRDGPYSTIDEILWDLSVVLVFAIPAGIGMTSYFIWNAKSPRWRGYRPNFPTVLFWLGFAGLVFVTQVDPHHFFDWWLD